MNIPNPSDSYSVAIYNDSSILVGGKDGAHRFDYNNSHFWYHSQVYSILGEFMMGIALHPRNRSEGYMSHWSGKKFSHFVYNGTLIRKTGHFLNISTNLYFRDIKFNNIGTKLLGSLEDGTIFLASMCTLDT